MEVRLVFRLMVENPVQWRMKIKIYVKEIGLGLGYLFLDKSEKEKLFLD